MHGQPHIRFVKPWEPSRSKQKFTRTFPTY